jgi:hypothetical protein
MWFDRWNGSWLVVALVCATALVACSEASVGECNPLAADHCEGSSLVQCSMGRGNAPTLVRTTCEHGCFDAPNGPVCAHLPTSPCTPGTAPRCGVDPENGSARIETCRALTEGGIWEHEAYCPDGCRDGECITP